MNKDLLRSLPKIDELYTLMEKDYPTGDSPSLYMKCLRETVEELRSGIISNTIDALPSVEDIIRKVHDRVSTSLSPSLRQVVNGTGITLHTNFGRAVMSKEAAKAAYNAAIHYTNLEYDLSDGKRGTRYSHIEKYICDITGAEAALAVNNNAAAIMLVLHAIGYGRNMVISRGELVEIGGSFRIPAVMEISGVTLNEVGTTNRTHPEDYLQAIDENTAALLKVHSSNFFIDGYTCDVSVPELKAALTDSGIDLPIIYDLGSGDSVLFDKNADIMTFSGDKLLGGPQAGIICGKKKYIDIIKKDHLIRTLRLDKMTLAALEATLISYIKGTQDSLPSLKMLSLSEEEMIDKYNKLIQVIFETEQVYETGTPSHLKLSMEKTATQTGGGSRPDETLTDICMAVSICEYSADEIATALRLNGEMPIIGRIHEDKYLLSLRTVSEDDFEYIARALNKL